MKKLACAALLAVGFMSSNAAAQPAAVFTDYPAETTARISIAEETEPGMPMRLRFRRTSFPAVIAPAQVTEPLPADAQALMTVFDREADEMRKKVEQEIQTRRQTLITALQALQDGYTRDARLDEAVAIRNMIRQLKISHLHAQPNPGNLVEYANRIGEVLYFDVIGQTGSVIWGSEVYTCDSDMGTAAVHAGVLKPGERGVVKVTIIKSPESHLGSTQHGVSSSPWGSYSASYTIERPFAESPKPAGTPPAAR